MKKYDQEFKDEAVSLALSSDRPLTSLKDFYSIYFCLVTLI